MTRTLPALCLVLVLLSGGVASAQPSRPSGDAPALAGLGLYGVGLRQVTLIRTGQVDVPAASSSAGAAALKDRMLAEAVWYPARPARGARAVTYRYALPGEPPRGRVRFSSLGIAVRDAPAAAGRFPLVIVSHGYSNEPEAMSRLGENLASKGYVVAAAAAPCDLFRPPTGCDV